MCSKLCGILLCLCVLGLMDGRRAIAQEALVLGDADELSFEWQLRQALNKPISLEFVETPLGEIVPYLQELLGVQVQLDVRALEDAGAGPDTPVTFHCKPTAARHAIKLMLDRVELTWMNHHQVLVITSPDRANSMLIVRVYPVGDLVSVNGYGDDGETLGFDFDSLIDTVTRTVEPTTWDEVGGPGSISPFYPAAALVLSQTRDVHQEVEALLQALRRARSLQGLPTYESRTALENEARLRWEEQQRIESSTELTRFAPAAVKQAPITVEAWQMPRQHE